MKAPKFEYMVWAKLPGKENWVRYESDSFEYKQQATADKMGRGVVRKLKANVSYRDYQFNHEVRLVGSGPWIGPAAFAL